MFLVGVGVWLISDAIYSYFLYANSQSWRGDRQTWLKDHWVRLVRLGLAISIVIAGVRGE
jgi:hypothetical protein